jgi:hypothetical protein
VTSSEAGLTLMTAAITLGDNDGTSGGNTVISCFLTVNGSGSGNTITLRVERCRNIEHDGRA